MSGKIPGLLYFPDFLTKEEGTALLNLIDVHEFHKFIRRRQQFYGPTYYHTVHDVNSIQPDDLMGETTSYDFAEFDWLVEKIDKVFPFEEGKRPNQCLVNEYVERTGISSHFEDENAFGDYIVTVSLNSPIILTLKKPVEHTNHCQDIEKEVRVLLEVGSLLILTGESRYDWRHGITKAKYIRHPDTDQVVGVRDDQYRRISLTIRKLLESRKRVTVDAKKSY